MAKPRNKRDTARVPTPTVGSALVATGLPANSVAHLFQATAESLPDYKYKSHGAMLEARLSTVVTHIDNRAGTPQARAARATGLLAHYIADCHRGIPLVPMMDLCELFQQRALALLEQGTNSS